MYNIFFAQYRKFHLSYLDVTMAQTGCVPAHKLKCTDDIPDSWCTHRFGMDIVPCNANHGPVHCNGETGKCACNDGFCPVNGVCLPKDSVESKPGSEAQEFRHVAYARTMAAWQSAVKDGTESTWQALLDKVPNGNAGVGSQVTQNQ